jgi:hypothetical protein
MLTAASNVLPTNAGYVVAAYLVFLALVLIYVVIMAYKLTRIGRDVAELDELSRRAELEDATRRTREETRV